MVPRLRGWIVQGLSDISIPRNFQVDLPHNSSEQYSLSAMEKISSEDLQAGDLIFFGPQKRRINHVGLYLGEGRFIHASSKKGVTISNLDENYWKARLVGAKRHMGITKPGDVDLSDSTASVEISFTEKGAEMSLPLRRMSSAYSSLWGQGFFGLADWDDLYAQNGNRNRLNNHLELEFSRVLMRDSMTMKLSLLRDNFFTQPYDIGYAPVSLTSEPSFSGSYYRPSGYRHALKMASDINPLDWLRITPSFSFLEYDNRSQDLSYWGPSLGVEIQIVPFPKKWSLSAGLQYADERNVEDGTFNALDSWNSRQLSLMFGYHVTDDVRFQIAGQQGVRGLFADKLNDTDEQRIQRGLFLSLDWSF